MYNFGLESLQQEWKISDLSKKKIIKDAIKDAQKDFKKFWIDNEIKDDEKVVRRTSLIKLHLSSLR